MSRQERKTLLRLPQSLKSRHRFTLKLSAEDLLANSIDEWKEQLALSLWSSSQLTLKINFEDSDKEVQSSSLDNGTNV